MSTTFFRVCGRGSNDERKVKGRLFLMPGSWLFQFEERQGSNKVQYSTTTENRGKCETPERSFCLQQFAACVLLFQQLMRFCFTRIRQIIGCMQIHGLREHRMFSVAVMDDTVKFSPTSSFLFPL